MKNTITLEQFRKLETLADDLNDKKSPDGELSYLSTCLLTSEGDSTSDEAEAVMGEVEAYDWDGRTDIDTLRRLLADVGVELDESALFDGWDVERMKEENAGELFSYQFNGTAEEGRKVCRLYGFALVLKK